MVLHGGDGDGARSLTLGHARREFMMSARLREPFAWIRENGCFTRFAGRSLGAPAACGAGLRQPAAETVHVLKIAAFSQGDDHRSETASPASIAR
jgi:hypothetical protein